MRKANPQHHDNPTRNGLRAAIAAVTFTVAGAAIANPGETTQDERYSSDVTQSAEAATQYDSAAGQKTHGQTGHSAMTSTGAEADLRFQELDEDGDGYLDPQEFQAAQGVTGSQGTTAVDTNQDGQISRTEFAAFENGRTGESMQQDTMQQDTMQQDRMHKDETTSDYRAIEPAESAADPTMGDVEASTDYDQ